MEQPLPIWSWIGERLIDFTVEAITYRGNKNWKVLKVKLQGEPEQYTLLEKALPGQTWLVLDTESTEFRRGDEITLHKLCDEEAATEIVERNKIVDIKHNPETYKIILHLKKPLKAFHETFVTQGHYPVSTTLQRRMYLRGYGQTIKITGVLEDAIPGTQYTCTAIWDWNDGNGNARYQGWQLKAISEIFPKTPNTVAQLKSFLVEHIPGVGTETADKLIQLYGDDLPDKLDERNVFLDCMGESRAELAYIAWLSKYTLRELINNLETCGASKKVVKNLLSLYGADLISKIHDNPLAALMDADAELHTADTIARKLCSMESDDPRRVAAFLLWILRSDSHNGHCYTSRGSALEKTAKELGMELDLFYRRFEAEWATCSPVTDRIVEDNQGNLWAKTLWNDEDSVAQKISVLMQNQGTSGIRLFDYVKAEQYLKEIEIADLGEDTYLRLVEQRRVESTGGDLDKSSDTGPQSGLGIHGLSYEQYQAVLMPFSVPFSILTGGAGTGKTTVVKYITRVAQKFSCPITLAAPTGKAADRMSQVTGLDAGTIHSSFNIGVSGESFRPESKGLGLYIFDETSMVDISLMAAAFSAIPMFSTVLLVGDFQQLPSVGPGMCLSDLLEAQEDKYLIPQTRLTKIFRQADAPEGTVAITDLAYAILQREPCLLDPSNQIFQKPKKDESIASVVSELVYDRMFTFYKEKAAALGLIEYQRELTDLELEQFDPMGWQVLGAGKENVGGVNELNIAALGAVSQAWQDAVEEFPVIETMVNRGKATFERGSLSLRIGDKVVQRKNRKDLGLINGSMLLITDITEFGVSFAVRSKGRDIEMTLPYTDCEDIYPCWACTVHVSQGSEWGYVIATIRKHDTKWVSKGLLYTEITRSKRFLTIVGNIDTLFTGNSKDLNRRTRLQERLSRYIATGRGI